MPQGLQKVEIDEIANREKQEGEMTAIDMLSKCGASDIKETENGRAGSGVVKCIYCGSLATLYCCVDVGGYWLTCNSCGKVREPV